MASWDIEIKDGNQYPFSRLYLHILGYRVQFHCDIHPHVPEKRDIYISYNYKIH